jgi:hypothetical protein
MRHGRHAILLTLTVLSLLLVVPAAVLGQSNGTLDLGAILRERDPEAMIGALNGEMQEKVRSRWAELIVEDAKKAEKRNQSGLYPNPSLQAYVNRLGQTLIPKEASDNLLLSFKILEDPLPYADSSATGTVYLSSGMISLLDNESQLAFLLMHEAGHVMLAHHLQQTILEVKQEQKANLVKTIGTTAGTLVGGLLGHRFGGGSQMGAQAQEITLASAWLGYKFSPKAIDFGIDIAESFQNHRFMKEIQIESDQFATQVLLQHGFDAREAPTLMAKVGNIVHSSGATAELAFGDAGDLPQRSAKVTELLRGPYQPLVARILNDKGFRMSSPRFSQLMSELKRDNGLLALNKDLFVIARANLEEAAAVRTDDPLTMYGLGMLYRTAGRNEADTAKAASYLKAAMEFDEVRHRFPEAYLQYAVELLSREDPQRYPEVQRALKIYVVLYQRKSGGELPREMPFIYDYLDITGDRNWITYKVSNVSSEAPYQLLGDPKLDGNASVGEKPTRKK